MVSDISAQFTLKIVSFENFNTINLRFTGGGEGGMQSHTDQIFFFFIKEIEAISSVSAPSRGWSIATLHAAVFP